MARTHSSYTASPTRSRSPRRSPARRPSRDGSEYEMDLDALGLNSTFESSELQASYEPPVDRIDTSEIEGPDDFTMNMTYWMTADLPLAQIKSRKEAKGKTHETRMDAAQANHQMQVQDGAGTASHSRSHSASPTRRPNGTTADEATYSTPASERSMENDEKVRSFLSNLPDTDMEGAIAGTPLHIPKQSFLQVPRSSPPKARSLQPTVEDYDTPRKPTQETVIHHTSAVIDTNTHEALHNQIAELQSRLSQQELASKTRITELETILAYTRSDLETTRTDNYDQREKIARLEKLGQQQRAEADAARSSTEAQLKAKEEALTLKMRDYGEEMRLQNLAKLQNQREDFDQQLQALKEAKRIVENEAESRGQNLEQVQTALTETRQLHEQHLHEMNNKLENERGNSTTEAHAELTEQLSSVQARAQDLQAQLEKAAADAKAARERAERGEATRNAVQAEARSQSARISALETNLQAARFELECAHADVSAKQQLFQTNLDLNTRLRTLQSALDTASLDLAANGQPQSQDLELRTCISTLQDQLQLSRAETLAKEQESLHHIRSHEQLQQNLHTAQGRIEGLENTITTLRQQLAEAHRDNARIRTNSERLERDLEDINDRLHDTQAEADRRVSDVEQKLNKIKISKSEAERSLRELQSQHDDLIEGHEAMLEDVRDKAEDAVRKAGALLDEERREKKRIAKDLNRARDDLHKARADAMQKLANEDETSDDGITSGSPRIDGEKDFEITKLREIIRKQVSEMKVVKAEASALRKEGKQLKMMTESQSDLETTIFELKEELSTLRTEKANLQLSLDDQEAVNAAMDEKLAALLSRVMKERAKTVVGKRDGQWQESVCQVQNEKELLGKVLLRQWGREEVGIADEREGEKQMYQYKYVKRERV
jgi:hypothetical protein